MQKHINRLVLVIVAIVAAVAAWNFTHRPATAGFDQEAYLDRLRAGAAPIILAECTNQVVGLRQVVTLNLETSGENLLKWTAAPAVDYVKPGGGVDRTNLAFTFALMQGRLVCFSQH